MPDVVSSPPANDHSLAPRQQAARRRTRRWMLIMALTPIVIFAIFAVVSVTGGNQEPVVHPASTPRGYQAVTDAYYGFAIPKAWKMDGALSDASGDFYYRGPGGWVGENESVAKASPTPSTPVPRQLWAYGVTTPTKFTAAGGHRVKVPGTSFAWAVTLARPGGSRSSAVDVWEARSQTEVWLVVHGSPATEAAVLASLRGSAVN